MTKKSILALVVSSSDDLQSGLLALMTTIPPVGAVLVAENMTAAMRLVENHKPALIILELSSFPALDIISQIKTQWPQIHLIVLVDDLIQVKESENSGADRVLIKGFSPQKLIEVIEDFVASCERSNPNNTEQGGRK